MIKPIIFVTIGIFVAPFVAEWFTTIMEIGETLRDVNLFVAR